MNELLEKFGFTQSEVKVYYALLELGRASAGIIATKADVSSSKVYEILDRLIKKGLAADMIESGVKYFTAADPERIYDIVEERQKIIEQQKKEAQKVIKELKEKQLLAKYKSEATIYRGIKGLQSAFYGGLDHMDTSDEFLVMGSPSRTKSSINFFLKFGRDISKKKLSTKILTSQETKDEMIQRIQTYKNYEIKYTSETFPTTINILGDRVIIFPKESGDNFLIIVIDNKDIAESFKTQFQKLWEQDFEVKKGFDGVQKAFWEMLDELNPGEEYYVLGASWNGSSQQVDPFFIDFHNKREKRGVKTKLLFLHEAQKIIKDIKKYYGKLAEIKFLPKGSFEGIQFNFFKNKIIMFVWREKEPIVFTIEDKKIYDTFKAYFDQLWNQQVEVYEGVEDVKEAFKKSLDFGNYSTFAEGMKIYDTLGSDFFNWWQEEKELRGISSKGFIGKKYQDMCSVRESKTKFKFLSNYENSGVSMTFKEKAMDVLFGEKPVAYIIHDPIIAQNRQKNFDLVWNQKTQVVKGLDAIQEIFEEFLESGKGDFIGARGYFMDLMPTYIDKWEKRAIKQKFVMRNIVDPKVKGHRITQFPFVKTKYTLQKEFADLSVIWIYGTKVVISNWTEDEPTAIIIDDTKIHDLYKKQFEHLWNQKASTYTSQDEIELMYEEFYENVVEEFILFAAKPKDSKASSFNLNWVQKVAKKVPTRVLYYGKTKENIARVQEYKKLGINVRILDTEETLSLSTLISGEMVLNTMWDTQPTLFRLENKTLADSYKQNFNILWKKADEV